LLLGEALISDISDAKKALIAPFLF
jgi:hypothetical protein